MLLVAISVGAQVQKPPEIIEDGFSTSGSMDLYWETKNTDDRNEVFFIGVCKGI